MEGGAGGFLCIFSATTVTSFASEGEEYDDVEEEEHSPSEVVDDDDEDDDEDDEEAGPVLARFLTLANSEEDDILSLKSRSLF